MSGTHEIEAEIARTRAELKATVDELSDRLSPKAQATETVEDVKVAVADLRRRVTGDIKPAGEPEPSTKAWVVLGVGTALAAAVVTKIIRRL
jgi:predicted pyridoxine 5'-phosphate oxidase superfamily flavin-nucleotide-binding protein